MRKFSAQKNIAIVGGGPAGLMAAEAASARGHSVVLFDSMPSVGRKFLMAGRGGMNITHSEHPDIFIQRYGPYGTNLSDFLATFGPPRIIEWCRSLGIETFVGSSGRIFPKDFKAAPLLRSWIKRLRDQKVEFRVRHRWIGWNDQHHLIFQTSKNEIAFAADATILALGGGSWPSLGSDGNWMQTIRNRGIECSALKPSNCGFDMDWGTHFSARFAGSPLKSVIISIGGRSAKGDVILTETGIEGGPIYTLSPIIRDIIDRDGQAAILLDLCPDLSVQRLSANLESPRGSRSLSSHLKRCTGLPPSALALLHECVGPDFSHHPQALASLIKSLPLLAKRARPLAEAISSAGGVSWKNLDNSLQIKTQPGLFIAGEMLDWEAPTGGYLLTACLSMGYAAGQAAAAYLETHQP